MSPGAAGLSGTGGVSALGAFVTSDGLVEFVLPAWAARLVDGVSAVICAGVAPGFLVAM